MRKAEKLGGAGLAAFILVIGVVWTLLYSRAWLSAPGTHDLSDAQRTAVLKSALKRGGIAALREAGEMSVLQSEDIAIVGSSRCIGEHECARWVRSTRSFDRCGSVQARLHCAYEITDKAGNTAAGLVQTFRTDVDAPEGLSSDATEWLAEMRTTERPDADTAKAKLCEMGYCEPGALTKWKKPPRIARADPDAEARKRCNGVLADVVGKGKTCLDPGDAEAREFRDCKDGFCGPVMVALPKGRFTRGTSDAEAERLVGEHPAVKDALSGERPAREVTIGHHVAVGKFEVTFDEWDACHKDARCLAFDRPRDEGWGRGKRPVISVSWNDITRHYLPWLNAKLGLSGAHAYRLLTDAEWEYAARAGTTTRYAFGDAVSTSEAQYLDTAGVAAEARTTEVGSFRPNAFGLHDMHGNVFEWVEDCFTFMDDAADLPTDGSSRKDGMCLFRAFRGGGYKSGPMLVRSAGRNFNTPDSRMKDVGVRLARTVGARP
ncbi:MAG TPA: formylglycine-generating enzyme family protein [Beijerinckiaceae bacterium]|nr:formylglycine-generating enzyme family protein [Beijerinckiaceae bacterium]